MLTTHYYIGIDISKATLDWAIFNGKITVFQTQSENSEVGIKTALKSIENLPGFKKSDVVFCLEHTGIYSAHLLAYLYKLNFPIWLENSGVGRPITDQKSGWTTTRKNGCH